MNIRKSCLKVSFAILLFLFCSSILILSYINQDTNSIKDSKSSFSNIIEPFIKDKNPFNILFMVKEESGKKTDTMLVVNVDPSSLKVNIISIPRDTYYLVKGSSIPKINSAYEYTGPSGAIEAISNVLNVKIKYYVHINIKTFRQIVDILDGVDFYVPVDLNYDDEVQNLHIHLKKGMQRLNGDKAEQLLRFRKTQNEKYKGEISEYYDGSDLKREEIQKQFIKSFFDQKINIKYLTKIIDVVNTIFNNMNTNITLNDALQYVNTIANIKSNDIKWFQLPGKPEKDIYWYFMKDKGETEKLTAEYFVGEVLDK